MQVDLQTLAALGTALGALIGFGYNQLGNIRERLARLEAVNGKVSQDLDIAHERIRRLVRGENDWKDLDPRIRPSDREL